MSIYLYYYMAFGEQKGCYLKKEVAERIDTIVRRNSDIYSSRNHFIRAAVMNKLYMEEFLLGIQEPMRTELRSRLMRTELSDGKSTAGKD